MLQRTPPDDTTLPPRYSAVTLDTFIEAEPHTTIPEQPCSAPRKHTTLLFKVEIATAWMVTEYPLTRMTTPIAALPSEASEDTLLLTADSANLGCGDAIV